MRSAFTPASPLTGARSSRSRGNSKRSHRFDDEVISRATAQGGSFAVELHAPRGTVICFDSGSIHHGKPLAAPTATRAAATVYYNMRATAQADTSASASQIAAASAWLPSPSPLQSPPSPPSPPPLPPSTPFVFIELGGRKGETLSWFPRSYPRHRPVRAYVWEIEPRNLAVLRPLVRTWDTKVRQLAPSTPAGTILRLLTSHYPTLVSLHRAHDDSLPHRTTLVASPPTTDCA